MTQIDGFVREQLTFRHETKNVYRGGTGPAVIIMAEVPGITKKVIAFARHVVDAGCTAVLPQLFGEVGLDPTSKEIAKVARGACISKEFVMFATGKTSPVVGWLRELARYQHEQCGGPGVGAVGMCLTGGFALGMLVEPSVIAPVLSQPSLPVAQGPFKKKGGTIDISPDDLAKVKQRMAADAELCVLGYRFSDDPLVPEQRFAFLQEELGDRFIGKSFPSTSKRDHSVLTEQLQEEALTEVLTFFTKRLGVHR